LAIQLANGQGLLPRLAAIDAQLDRPAAVDQEVHESVIVGRVGPEMAIRRRSA
jgi:hypothetical protein